MSLLSIEQKWPIVIRHSLQPSVDLCVCVSVCPVHCGKTADRIWMRIGIVGWMRQVVGFGDCCMGGGNFGDERGAQWGVCGVVVLKCVNRRSCNLGWCRGSADATCSIITLGSLVIISARCNIYISHLCYDVSVRLSVCDGSALAHYS